MIVTWEFNSKFFWPRLPYVHAAEAEGAVGRGTGGLATGGDGDKACMLPRPRKPHAHAAKAKACSQGTSPLAHYQGRGMQQPTPTQPPVGMQLRKRQVKNSSNFCMKMPLGPTGQEF